MKTRTVVVDEKLETCDENVSDVEANSVETRMYLSASTFNKGRKLSFESESFPAVFAVLLH